MIQLSVFCIFAFILILHSVSCLRVFEYDASWPNATVPALPLHGSGVVPDFEDNLITLNRGSLFFPGRNETIRDSVVVVVDRITGQILRQWGENIFFHPHGITAAHNGDIFITDSVLHQVFKFAYQADTQLWNNEPIITLGQRFVSGADNNHFCIPADVAIEPDTENFYVADGYCNHRVVKFDRCGNYLLEFSAGTSDSSIPIVPFNIVHKLIIAVPHSPTTNRALRRSVNSEDVVVAVADRDNCRIQYFYGNGSFMYEQTHQQLGIPKTWLMSVAHVDVNPANAPYNSDFPADFGIIYAVDSGSAGEAPVAPEVIEIGVGRTNATVISSFRTNNTDPYIRRGLAHDLTVSRDGGEVYVVISNSTTLIVKRFQMKVESSAGNKVQFISCSVLILLTSLCTRILL